MLHSKKYILLGFMIFQLNSAFSQSFIGLNYNESRLSGEKDGYYGAEFYYNQYITNNLRIGGGLSYLVKRKEFEIDEDRALIIPIAFSMEYVKRMEKYKPYIGIEVEYLLYRRFIIEGSSIVLPYAKMALVPKIGVDVKLNYKFLLGLSFKVHTLLINNQFKPLASLNIGFVREL